MAVVGDEVTMKAEFFFQAEDGVRAAQGSRGLGDVYERQKLVSKAVLSTFFCLIELPEFISIETSASVGFITR